MKKSKRLLILFLLTLCPICSKGYSQTIAETSIDALRVRAGWTAPTDGYFLTDFAMRDTVSGWAEAVKIADVREQALVALREEIKMQQGDLKRQLAALQSEIAAERKAWRSRVRWGKAQGLVYGLVIGFGGGYLVRRNNP